MEKIIEKASVLVEVLPYIQKFRGEVIVVKLGGSIMENPEGVRSILRDVAFMDCAGLRPVLVHGGGKSISRAMAKAGLEPVFRKGLRVTDEAAMRVVEHVLNHEVNPEIVATLAGFGCETRGMHGDDLLRVRKHVVTDRESGESMDWGFVGEPEEVDIALINAYLHSGITPVITPLGRDAQRQIYNVNADEAAAAIARDLKARKLVFLSDVPGLLSDPADPTSLISSLRARDVPELARTGVLAGGMLPKISGAVKAIEAGVKKTHIIDSALPHSLLLELFTDQGVGTEIVADSETPNS